VHGTDLHRYGIPDKRARPRAAGGRGPIVEDRV
jgi:hypothetical protein